MSQILPLDARVRELWKATAISAAESTQFGSTCVKIADEVTQAFIERFYPDSEIALDMVTGIKNAQDAERADA